MKKIAYLGIFLFAAVLSSCNDGKNEKRIAELEEKLTAMQTTQASATPAVNNPITTTAANATVITKPEGPLPKFEFTEESYDFGTIDEGEVVEHTFNFKNVGEAPLIIQNATSTCGCTVPSWPRNPIAAGESAKITVKFDSKGKAGQTNKPVSITANTFPKVTKVTIKGTVNKKALALPDGPVKQ